MIGYFDAEDGNPKVVLEIKGQHRSWKQIPALFDTGHSGSLSLPIMDLIEVGAKFSNIGEATYADGRSGVDYLFSIKVRFNGIEKKVEASMIQNPKVTMAIAGIKLFSPFISFIDFKNGKLEFMKEGDFKKLLRKKK